MLVFEDLNVQGSSSIAAASYSREQLVLQITFRSRHGLPERTYNYSRVPASIVDEMLAAKSLGEFVNRRIKPGYDATEVT